MHTKHLEEFIASGLSNKTIHLAKYESVDEQIIDDGFDDKGRKRRKKIGAHWRIPYIDPINKKLHYYRIKPDEPKIENKGKANERAIKYLTPKGAKPHLYFSQQIVNWEMSLKTDKTIYITEGEKKTDKLIQEGFLAVGVSGVWCWQSDHAPIKDLEYLAFSKRKAVLVFDSDWQTNPQVKKALHGLGEALRSMGLSVMYACCPGPEKGIDDYLVEHGIDAWKDYLSVLEERFSEQSAYEYEVETAAKEMLQSPDLMQVIVDDVHKLGVVDEEENIKLLYLAMASHKMDKCVGVIVKGESSTGKTFLVKTIMNLMPLDVTEAITGHSTQALSYWTDISHKIIMVGESRPPNDEFWETDSLWRQLIEDNEITRKIVTKNKEGKQVLETITVKGPIVYISTTTAPNLHEENENRLLIINTDDTLPHINKVLKAQREEEGLSIQEKNKLRVERQFIIDKHRFAMSLLSPLQVDSIFNPLASKIKFNTYGSYTMRDQKKLFRILRILAYLHQFQRVSGGFQSHSPMDQKVPSDYRFDLKQTYNDELGKKRLESPSLLGRDTPLSVCVSIEDYKIAYDILKPVFNSTASEVPSHLLKKWNILYTNHKDNDFDVDDIRRDLNLKRSQAFKVIKLLEDLKMIEGLPEDLESHSKKRLKKYRCIYFNNRECEMIKPEDIEKEPIADKLHYSEPVNPEDIKNPSNIKENEDSHTHTDMGSSPEETSGLKDESAPISPISENQTEIIVSSVNLDKTDRRLGIQVDPSIAHFFEGIALDDEEENT